MGPTGTGKTVYIRQGLDALAVQGGYHMIATAFSAQTSANQVCLALNSSRLGGAGCSELCWRWLWQGPLPCAHTGSYSGRGVAEMGQPHKND